MAVLRLFGHERDRQRAAFRPSFRASTDATDTMSGACDRAPIDAIVTMSIASDPSRPMRLQSLQSHGSDPASPMQVQSLHLHGQEPTAPRDGGSDDASVIVTFASDERPGGVPTPCNSHDENCIQPPETRRRRATAHGPSDVC